MDGACAGGVYATFIAGDSYVPLARCLASQLQRVSSKCPFVVVFDDREAATSSEGARALREHVGTVFPLTTLFATLSNRTSNTSDATSRGAAFFGPPPPKAPRAGRRLYAATRYYTPWLKLWLWALPFPAVVYLDADVVVLRNLDRIFVDTPKAAPRALFAAVPVRCPIPYMQGRNLKAFNSGILWLRPSIERLRQLQKHANETYAGMARGHKPNKACEQRISDQTLLYWYVFRQRHLLADLPLHYNAPASNVSAEVASAARLDAPAYAARALGRGGGGAARWPSVVHYLNEPKPWAACPSRLPRNLAGPQFLLWQRRACPPDVSFPAVTPPNCPGRGR